MTHPVVHTIIQGETLDLEIRMVGESLTGASAEVKVDEGLDLPAISTSITPPDTINIRSTNTGLFLLGTHRLRLWVTWPDGDEEVVVEILVAVKPSITAWSESDLVIDGGAPGTEFTESIDGGEA